ncbi:MAG TPA: molybdate ABC transporter permease subunit [Vicinamibacteria bacterium]|nr:molybdate ABC transporter permease subunit [Vicinamibacteria bacterium]
MALAGVLLTLPLGVALGFWLARTERRGKSLVETLATLPLVLPPTVVGLFLLELFGRNRPVGRFLYDHFGLSVAFTWRAVVFASAVVAFPLLVRTVRTSFEEIDPRLEAIARTLGRGRLGVFFTVSLPLASRGILAGFILAFSRALGEFGATIMVAGNIPGETQTLSLAIFQLVQLGRDPEAYRLAAVTVLVALVAIWLADRLSRRPRSKSVVLR